MISVLIPNYNFDCLPLVRDLHAQLTESGVPFEIIVVEDGSTRYLENNGQMTVLPGVRYIVRTENAGRLQMRNLLPSLAHYPYLLCMDSDARVIRSDYIRKYLAFALRGERKVVVGGMEMESDLPDPSYRLRFVYGRKREGRTDRKKGFTTFNYMIPAEVWRRVEVENDTFRGYGHEDTVLGLKIKRLGVGIEYIDNPLVHLGLDTNRQMLDKAVSAGENLLRFHESGKYPELPSESRLLACYLKVRKWRLSGPVLFIYRMFERLIRKNLNGFSPDMRVFDFFRLGEMLRSAKRINMETQNSVKKNFNR